MENQSNMALDSTVRSQDSTNSNDSKDSKVSKDSKLSKDSNTSGTSKDSKPDSCLESKHSKDVLISDKHHRSHHNGHQPNSMQQQQQNLIEPKDDSAILMFTSCGQLLLGIVLVVFGVLVLVHGASLGGSGAGLWAGAGALVAGALGIVATLATSAGKTTSGFSTAHLASSLVALALSNMAAITAITAIVRDSQRTPDILLAAPGSDGHLDAEEGWAGLLASIGLLIASVAELFVSGYCCATLTPKLCSCLRPGNDSTIGHDAVDGRLKTRNMVHQWVITQNRVPKNQPIYVVQPVMPMHPIIQPPYGMHPPLPGKFAGGFVSTGTLPMPAPAYGAMSMLPHMAYPSRPPSQMVRAKHKRHYSADHVDSVDRRRQHQQHVEEKQASKRMTSIGEDQVDLAKTYTGLDKKISEEFISIAMDPERKSKSSSQQGSEIGAAKSS